jgi:hypothetical protein
VITGLGVFAFQEWLRAKHVNALEQLKARIAIEQHTSQARWEIKRNACLNAMRIIDAHWSNLDWSGIDSKDRPIVDGSIEKQPEPSIEDVRQCYNELVVSCGDNAVPKLYKHCLLEKVSGDDAIDLRNAVRTELGFGIGIDFDRSRAFIGTIRKLRNRLEPTGETPAAQR